MNPCNVGQCNRRRNSYDARSIGSGQDNNGPNFPKTEWGETTQDQNILDSQHPSINGSNHSLRRVRPRSGSWSGVTESDDELERLAKSLPYQPPLIRISSGTTSHNSTMTNCGGSLYGAVETNGEESPVVEGSTTTTNTMPGNLTTLTQDRMRRRLKFFFMNPYEKWHARRRFPWKLLLQIIKIVIVTLQLSMFAQQRYNHVNYLWNTKVAFSHLFIEGWDSSREVTAYPPANGPLAIYTKDEFYSYIDKAYVTYWNMKTDALGMFDYVMHNGTIQPPEICAKHLQNGTGSVSEEFLSFNGSTINECINVPLNSSKNFSSKKFFEDNDFVINFNTLLSAEFNFDILTVRLRTLSPGEAPRCYRIMTKLFFNNREQDGQILIELDVGARVLNCKSEYNYENTELQKKLRTSINIVTIILCALSLIMCLRALYRAQILRMATQTFFKRHFNKVLSFDEQMEFLNLWYVVICMNDVLIILGSILKIGLETEMFLIGRIEFAKGSTVANYEGFMDTWNVCSLLLGLGNLLIWFGCLRYLGFFETYNVLILTLKKCLPNVLRYSICILMVFAGYSLCGWLVLGPYHLKFGSLTSTMECLYSLINGDDMFATFSSTSGKDPLVWWFSRLYLYSFISLFIYVILSLFIAIIMDAYETVKKCYDEGFPTSPLMKFVHECQEEPCSGVYQVDGERTIHDVINNLFCCCRRHPEYEEERTRLIEERTPIVA
ncbi:mucolipin-3-like isoform X3 [Oratosquilla oratoria]|uniref:mucolipin-3-like isoform X3 n=1 Tax=Oratosquilla oratoria TaxID=337810 RepID=UPI003F76BBFC